MAANNALRITSLDFDSIKQSLKTFLSERSGFDSFNFEGSNWNLLLDVLSYNTHMNGYYINAVANELFLDSAQLRDSVLSHAKLMNYTPTSKRAATAYIDVLVTPSTGESTTQTTLVLNKYTRFISNSDDGKTLMFAVNGSDTITKANGSFLFSNVQIKQGDVITTQNIFNRATNQQRRFNIPSANVDTSTLSVIVQRSLTNTTTDIYTLADDITEVTSDSTVYYLEENPESNGSYSIIFGDNYLGKQPANGAVVIMSYIDTLGPLGNDAESFTLVDDIDGYSSNVVVSTVSGSASGSNKESVESIKFRAPIHYSTQNRAVTTKDYENLLLKDYPNIQAISVWGGQDNDPPVYGKVFISMLPRDGYYITEIEKQRIITEVISNRSIVTVTPEIVDPEILYLVLNLSVRYDPSLTNLTSDQLEALVRATVVDYKDTQLVDFNDSFRSSVLLRNIDDIDPSIRGSELTVYVQKRVELTPNTASNYIVNFGLKLKPGGVFDRIDTYPDLLVADINGVNRNIKIEENANTLTGITSIIVRSGGNGYLRNPNITITGDGIGATANATIVNGSVDQINVITTGTGYTQASVVITGGSGTGATAIARLQADRATLYSYYFGNYGKKVLVDASIGTIFYDLGKISLRALTPITVTDNDQYSQNILAINAIPASSIISSNRNRIVSIDEDDTSAIQITMIAER